MRLKTIKTGYAVKVGKFEGLHFASGTQSYRDEFSIVAKRIEEIGECVIEITNIRTKEVAWTTFSNVVYAEPDFESIQPTLEDVQHAGTLTPSDSKAKRGRPRKNEDAQAHS